MEFKPVPPRVLTNYTFQARLTREQYETIEKMAHDEQTPMTAIVRLAIDEFLSRVRRERAA